MNVSTLTTAVWLLVSVGVIVAALIDRSKRDAVTWLTVYLVMVFGFSARLVFSPAGAIGTPALGVGAIITWLYWLQKTSGSDELDRDWQPVRVAVVVCMLWMLTSTSAAYARPLSDLEISGSTREVIRLVIYAGTALVAADAITTRARLDTLLRRLVFAASFLSLMGIAQFITGTDVTAYFRPPGLTVSHETVTGIRSSFNRPFGTALHPIELGVVLSLVLPLAIHFARFEPRGTRRQRAVAAAIVIACGIPMSLSRSGIIALAVAMITLSTIWTWRERANAAVMATGFLAVMYATIPGLLGTIVALFENSDTDPSVQNRIARIPQMLELFGERPLFGRGFGTYNIEDYFLLDNEYFVTAIEVGLLGLAVVIAVLLTGVFLARGVRHRGGDLATRHLGQCIASGLLAAMATMYTFDAFYFHVYSSVLFLLLGCAGALWRLESDRRRRHAVATASAPKSLIGAMMK